jgi:hypothetical protein
MQAGSRKRCLLGGIDVIDMPALYLKDAGRASEASRDSYRGNVTIFVACTSL